MSTELLTNGTIVRHKASLKPDMIIVGRKTTDNPRYYCKYWSYTMKKTREDWFEAHEVVAASSEKPFDPSVKFSNGDRVQYRGAEAIKMVVTYADSKGNTCRFWDEETETFKEVVLLDFELAMAQ